MRELFTLKITNLFPRARGVTLWSPVTEKSLYPPGAVVLHQGDFAPLPQNHLATSADSCGCYRSGCCRHLVGGDQTLPKLQCTGQPHSRDRPAPNARSEKPCRGAQPWLDDMPWRTERRSILLSEHSRGRGRLTLNRSTLAESQILPSQSMHFLSQRISFW